MPYLVSLPLIVALALSTAPASLADDTRTLRHDAVVNAPVSDVWDMWTDEDKLRTWMAPNVTLDLRVGGAYRASYNPDSDLNDADTIVNRILAYEPMRMIAIRNEQAPEGFVHPDLFVNTWSVATFEPLPGGRTRLVITGHGYGHGPEWDELYTYFQRGNQMILDLLTEQLNTHQTSTTEQVHAHLDRMVGGVWMAEGPNPQGGTLRSAFVIRSVNGGSSHHAEGWLGMDGSVKPHAVVVYGLDPTTNAPSVWQFLEGDAVMIGTIWDENKALHQRTDLTMPGQPAVTLHATYAWADDNTIEWAMTTEDGQQMAALTFHRRPIEHLNDWLDAPAHDASTHLSSPTERAIEIERTIRAPVAEVWRTWTTNEGFREAFDRSCTIDLRVGGPFVIEWDPDAPAGQRGSEGCRILSYSPREYLAFEWNAPPAIPDIRTKRTVVTVHFQDQGDGTTSLRLKNHGYGTGPAWDEAFAYFQNAWPWVMDRVAEHHASP